MNRTECHPFLSDKKDDEKKKKLIDEYENEIKHSTPKTDGLKRRPVKDYSIDSAKKLNPSKELDEASKSSPQATDNSDIVSNQSKSSEDSCTSSKEVTTNSKFWKKIIIFVIALVLFVIVFYSVYKYLTNETQSNSEQLKVNVDQVIEDLKAKFNYQPDFTFRVVKAALRRVTLKEVSAPGILVLISSQKSQDTNSKFAHHLVESISQHGGYGYISIQIDNTSSAHQGKKERNMNNTSSAHQLKKEINMNITNNLTQNPHLVILVDKLNQLPFEAAMIFHSYCDHENAPFKRTVYVMTVSVSKEISPASTGKEWDVLASESLSSAWKGSNEDQVNSLISRLTGSVAAIVDKS